MTDDEKQVQVRRTIDASAADVFHVLSDPHRHPELDGSGFVRSLDHGDRIQGTGQVFRMNMAGDHMGGEYQTDNVVTGYDHNALVAWRTAPAGQEPPGWEWIWELAPAGPDSTDVTLTYRWADVTDPELLKKISFPLVPASDLEQTLGKLAEAVSG